MTPKALAASVSLLVLLSALPARSAEPSAAFLAASASFTRATTGDSAATEQALKAFEALAAAESPEAPLYQAYVGAAQTLQGREAWMPWTKMKATERGLDTLDKALRRLESRHDAVVLGSVPVSLETRLVAANTFVSVPDAIFHRADAGRRLLQELVAHPLFAQMPPEFRSRVEKLAASSRK